MKTSIPPASVNIDDYIAEFGSSGDPEEQDYFDALEGNADFRKIKSYIDHPELNSRVYFISRLTAELSNLAKNQKEFDEIVAFVESLRDWAIINLFKEYKGHYNNLAHDLLIFKPHEEKDIINIWAIGEAKRIMNSNSELKNFLLENIGKDGSSKGENYGIIVERLKVEYPQMIMISTSSFQELDLFAFLIAFKDLLKQEA